MAFVLIAPKLVCLSVCLFVPPEDTLLNFGQKGQPIILKYIIILSIPESLAALRFKACGLRQKYKGITTKI